MFYISTTNFQFTTTHNVISDNNQMNWNALSTAFSTPTLGTVMLSYTHCYNVFSMTSLVSDPNREARFLDEFKVWCQDERVSIIAQYFIDRGLAAFVHVLPFLDAKTHNTLFQLDTTIWKFTQSRLKNAYVLRLSLLSFTKQTRKRKSSEEQISKQEEISNFKKLLLSS